MNNSQIAILIVCITALLIVVGIYLATKTDSKKATEEPVEMVDNNSTPKGKEGSSSLSGDKAFQGFLDWKKNKSHSPQDIDSKLSSLVMQFPDDYRFSLERIRGEALIAGTHSHSEAFEILTEAAEIAIECKCGDAKQMKTDLLAYKNDKQHGFWKLSTHPKQWNVIIKALDTENVAELKQLTENHH